MQDAEEGSNSDYIKKKRLGSCMASLIPNLELYTIRIDRYIYADVVESPHHFSGFQTQMRMYSCELVFVCGCVLCVFCVWLCLFVLSAYIYI